MRNICTYRATIYCILLSDNKPYQLINTTMHYYWIMNQTNDWPRSVNIRQPDHTLAVIEWFRGSSITDAFPCRVKSERLPHFFLTVKLFPMYYCSLRKKCVTSVSHHSHWPMTSPVNPQICWSSILVDYVEYWLHLLIFVILDLVEISKCPAKQHFTGFVDHNCVVTILLGSRTHSKTNNTNIGLWISTSSNSAIFLL